MSQKNPDIMELAKALCRSRTEHTPYHMSFTWNGERVDFWHTTGKLRYKGNMHHVSKGASYNTLAQLLLELDEPAPKPPVPASIASEADAAICTLPLRHYAHEWKQAYTENLVMSHAILTASGMPPAEMPYESYIGEAICK